jgi:hypothetical protein
MFSSEPASTEGASRFCFKRCWHLQLTCRIDSRYGSISTGPADFGRRLVSASLRKQPNFEWREMTLRGQQEMRYRNYAKRFPNARIFIAFRIRSATLRAPMRSITQAR